MWIILARYVARMAKLRNSCNILVWKHEGKGLFGSPRSRWEDQINSVDWIKVTKDRVQWRDIVNTAMNL
jgi:hypothetical protein